MHVKRASNADQYLMRIGNTYYAQVRVPRTLEAVVGQRTLRRSLKTSSRAEANLRKHAMVARLKAELASLKANPSQGKLNGDEIVFTVSVDSAGQAASNSPGTFQVTAKRIP